MQLSYLKAFLTNDESSRKFIKIFHIVRLFELNLEEYSMFFVKQFVFMYRNVDTKVSFLFIKGLQITYDIGEIIEDAF